MSTEQKRDTDVSLPLPETTYAFETVFIRTRDLKHKLEVPVTSVRQLSKAWEKVMSLKPGEREIYIDASPESLNTVFDYLAGYRSTPPRGVYSVLTGQPQISDTKLQELAQEIKIAIHTAVAKIEGVPPSRTELHIDWSSDVGSLDLSDRLKLKRLIELQRMDLVAPNGYAFPKVKRILQLTYGRLILQGPAPEKPARKARRPVSVSVSYSRAALGPGETGTQGPTGPRAADTRSYGMSDPARPSSLDDPNITDLD